MATINTLASSLHERVMALTDGHGAEVVVEAVGLADTFVAAVHEVAFAGRVVFIGYAKTPRHSAIGVSSRHSLHVFM